MLVSVVRLAEFEPATFGSGDRRSSPAELQAHIVKILDFSPEFQPIKHRSRSKWKNLWKFFRLPACPRPNRAHCLL